MPHAPGEPALGRLGFAAPPPDPADTSPHAFPDGGRWRTEIPSVEGPEALAAVLEESTRLGVPVHRISQGSGVWMLTDAEIADMVAACAARDIELSLFTGPRGTWDTGGATRSPSGGAGLRARGHDQLAGCVEDALRAARLGVRCLLVADEGVLWLLHGLREMGELPADTTFKVSALVGPVNPAAYAVWERLGADSLNIPSDLSLQQLTEIRRVSAAPMDLYVEAPDDLGGYVRMYDAAELIRRGAPLYLKFGLSKAPGIYPYGAHMRETVLATARERVRRGRLVLDLLDRLGAGGAMSPPGSRLPGALHRFPGAGSGVAPGTGSPAPGSVPAPAPVSASESSPASVSEGN
ncbi:hypothetical protein DMB38_08400 [Streptomyces sp. WAC 06738]|uniref:hypothetical protein n=1 Tax=Streptomyces sp. WAC 06738 TaxID=2203210 RepID=UPI000F6CD94D|nr:hypothetical protein [Streptomyces sp. WAC 06738]AZM45848.1 hypothetical protein DMB38_08400 [Streptomyces sp. WAC 06738]